MCVRHFYLSGSIHAGLWREALVVLYGRAEEGDEERVVALLFFKQRTWFPSFLSASRRDSLRVTARRAWSSLRSKLTLVSFSLHSALGIARLPSSPPNQKNNHQGDFIPLAVILCPGEDLNLHALRHTLLRRACLPVSAPGQNHIRRTFNSPPKLVYWRRT